MYKIFLLIVLLLLVYSPSDTFAANTTIQNDNSCKAIRDRAANLRISYSPDQILPEGEVTIKLQFDNTKIGNGERVEIKIWPNGRGQTPISSGILPVNGPELTHTFLHISGYKTAEGHWIEVIFPGIGGAICRTPDSTITTANPLLASNCDVRLSQSQYHESDPLQGSLATALFPPGSSSTPGYALAIFNDFDGRIKESIARNTISQLINGNQANKFQICHTDPGFCLNDEWNKIYTNSTNTYDISSDLQKAQPLPIGNYVLVAFGEYDRSKFHYCSNAAFSIVSNSTVIQPPSSPVPSASVPIIAPVDRAPCVGSACTRGGGDPCDPDAGGARIRTAIGCIHTSPVEFVKDFLKFIIAISGGLAFLMMLLGAFQMLTSAGNPDSLNAGRERLTSAVIGLLFVIFAILLMQIIGFDILKLPGFGR